MALHLAFSWQLFLQNGRLLERVARLEEARGPADADANAPLALGSAAPAFALPDLDGRIVTSGELVGRGRETLLFFTDPACGHCDPVLPELTRAGNEAGGPDVVVVSRGAVADNRAKAQEHGLARVLLQADLEVAEAYRVFGFPGAVLLDRDGTVASGRALGAEDVIALVRSAGAPRLEIVSAARR
jgi:methylamine dehydrogenase accessory protein MauD